MKQNFQKQKKQILGKKDKSSKGEWDSRIIDLCRKINKKKEYYTTSSCAGRITLVKDLPEKRKGVFLFMTHNRLGLSQLRKNLKKITYKKLIYFKQEPCILHIACSDINNANRVLNKAILAGWKRSGILSVGKRVMLELISTEKLELPIISKGKILVNDDYLRLLIKEANKKLERTWGKIRNLEKLI